MSYGVNAPMGLEPVRMLDGSAWTGALNSYQIATTYATALYTGDPVTIGTSGFLEVGAAGSAIVGVFMGVKWTDSTGRVRFEKFWPGNPGVLTGSTVEALVIDDPNAADDVNSEVTLETAIDWWEGTMSTRLNDQNISRRITLARLCPSRARRSPASGTWTRRIWSGMRL